MKPCPVCGNNPDFAAWSPNAFGVMEGRKPYVEIYHCGMEAKAETLDEAVRKWEAGETQVRGVE